MSRIKTYSPEERKKAIKLLIENGLNFTKTANEFGVTRQTIYKWKEEHYNEFKSEIDTTRVEEEAKRLPLPEGKIRRNTEHLFDSAIEHFLKDNAAMFKKLTATQQLKLVEIIAPYVLQKKENEKGKQPGNTQNNFFANFFNSLQNGNNESTDKGNTTTINLPG